MGSSRDGDERLPLKWFKTGSHPDDYTVGVDRQTFYAGSASALIQARSDPKGFATLMQKAKADPYRGQRIRLTAHIKTRGVGGRDDEGWAGLWMRVDGGDRSKMLAFDNMESRPIRGTTEWTEYEVVLEIADDADVLNYGLLLSGPGLAWLDQLRFAVVDSDVSVTDTMQLAQVYDEPANLDFEDDA